MKKKETIHNEATENVENTDINAEGTEVEEQVESAETDKAFQELAEMKEKYLRLYSEFDNFRRRTAKEKVELIQNASEGLIKDLIPVLDDFERANKSFENTSEIEPLKEGLALVFNKFQKVLQSKGLKAMETKGQDFDPELAECIAQFAAGENEKGKVVDEIEKGYLLNDKVIRYAKVVVGS